MGFSGFGAAAGPKAPYVSAQTGPRQPVLALTWTTLVADAWGCRADRSEAEADRPTPIFLFFDFPVIFLISPGVPLDSPGFPAGFPEDPRVSLGFQGISRGSPGFQGIPRGSPGFPRVPWGPRDPWDPLGPQGTVGPCLAAHQGYQPSYTGYNLIITLTYNL